MRTKPSDVACVALVVLGAVSAAAPAQVVPGAGADCVPVASWVVPGGERTEASRVIARAATQSAVLLGEMHESFEHHRWQAQTLAALHAARPDMVIGFEMFPRRAQKALDRWVAGEISETEFLAVTDWRNVWGFNPDPYLPLFHFARINRIPMVALNVDERLRREAAAKGFEGIAESEREGVTRPAAPSTAYLDYLLPIYREHDRGGGKRPGAGRDDPDFQRFVESQQLWDRAMAQAIHSALARPKRPLVVGIMGSGHVVHGYGVPHQLRDLGIADVTVLLPWDRGADCRELVAGIADAVFGVAAPVVPALRRQRLGIRIEPAAGGVRVAQVDKGSLAEAAGIREGDVIAEMAGLPVKQTSEVSETVQRQAPGTWLPLKVRRGDETVEIIAKFPPVAR